MKLLLALIVACFLSPALAQHRYYSPQGSPGAHRPPSQAGAPNPPRPMPPPERRMGWDERIKLREQVRSGEMTREEARQQWRERRDGEHGRSPEERERLRRDVMDANRDLERR